MDNISYLAGFMDGEGTITLKRIKRKGLVYHQPYISCAQVIKGIKALDLLKDTFGGSFYTYRQKGMRSDTVQWVVASQKALECAKQLLPYLILKKKQAELLISFYDLERTTKY